MKSLTVFLMTFCFCFHLWAADRADPLERIIHLPKQKTTVYNWLNEIGDMAGYNFIYDSKLVANDRPVKLPAEDCSVRDAVYKVLGSTVFLLKVVEKYIVIDRPASPKESVTVPVQEKDTLQPIVVSGAVYDKLDNMPVADCAVTIYGTGIGTVANSNGQFMLKIPYDMRREQLRISHLGYETQQLPILLFHSNPRNIYLTERIIPMQEVIVRMVNPRKIVDEVLQFRAQNYPVKPYYLTTFYREGIEKRKTLLTLTESVFKVYKTSCLNPPASDQMKLLKMRKITNESVRDTFLLKMKAGPDATLLLDIIKSVPDFLQIDDDNQFNYSKIDMTVYDSHLAHVVAFEQKENEDEPLYTGKLYIDAQNAALLHAEFEINPKYINKAEYLFIAHRGRNVRIHPQQVIYNVSYKELNGKYYINYIRGDLYFKMKTKHQLFYSPFHIFLEMATCSIDTLNAKPFPRSERLKTTNIFSDTDFQYDAGFWGNFNIILPNEQLNEAISKIAAKVEEADEGTIK
ncbi:carboxypeptidase-like regulatory domain-containing protein [Microbacter margulisiae]|uniref:CarboxypepD_reg-like domain-containing protein n=1 Tax=Microbacter margulisiae TaxID=1350067 RepID=A0A7W5H2G9_9PORP|nr:carboxypeptidase-like regulatory domain-containing protein [Microbacter margulisiae]MBB3187609.1 hypothetical protein [Microbacter margulisiae]